MSSSDPTFRRKFRKNVEQKLNVATTNNPRVIASWELSRQLDRVDVMCHENSFDERVISHLEASLIRLLGVGKSLGALDSQVQTFTVSCVGTDTSEILAQNSYQIR
jgi:hypothetical protein